MEGADGSTELWRHPNRPMFVNDVAKASSAFYKIMEQVLIT